MPDAYRQYRSDADLYIERYTARVPQDGKWYVIHRNEIVGSYRSLKAAQTRYQTILTEIGHTLPKSEPFDSTQALRSEAQDEFVARQEMYWAKIAGARRGGRFSNRRKH
jgi:hypothetical protein